SYRRVLAAFSILHWVALVLSGIIGVILITRRTRVFNSYRFNLVAAFLLGTGLVGNFFLLGSEWRDAEQIFRVAVGVHLLLLIGILCQEHVNRPGDLRNRFARLGGASLWLALPVLLFLGVPLIAEGMRLMV